MSRANIDGYINYLVTILIDSPNLREKSKNAIPLIFHTFFRPEAADEPVSRSDPLSLRKLKGREEVNLSGIRVVLGWKINTKKMIVRPPKTKIN